MQNLHFWVQDQKLKELTDQPPWLWNLVEILEILLLHVLSNDACKFATNLFPISWEPFENVNLLYFLFWMQICNGCNALNIAGNPIKDISAKFTFLSSGSKVERWLTPPWLWPSVGNLGNSTFAWYSPMMHVNLGCHKPFPHQLIAIWKC